MYKNGLIDQVEVLKKSEVVDVEGVLERFGYIRQLEGQMQQLQEEVKKLRGDLQTAEREEVHAKKRLEVEKFASGLDSIKNRADASRAIQEMQMKQDIEKLTAIPSGTQSPMDLLGLEQNEQQ
jgi:TolA-binding protein